MDIRSEASLHYQDENKLYYQDDNKYKKLYYLYYQNLISSSLSHTQPVHQVSSGSVHNFLRYPVHKQTKTDKKKQAGRRTWVVDYPIEPDAMGPFDGK